MTYNPFHFTNSSAVRSLILVLATISDKNYFRMFWGFFLPLVKFVKPISAAGILCHYLQYIKPIT